MALSAAAPGTASPQSLSALIERLQAEFTTEPAMLEALARLESAENAFPEDLLARGRQIFATVRAVAGERLCHDPTITQILEANGPRTSEVLTIIPLLLNLLPDQSLKESSVALIALLIVRMGLGTFCQHYRQPPPPPAP